VLLEALESWVARAARWCSRRSCRRREAARRASVSSTAALRAPSPSSRGQLVATRPHDWPPQPERQRGRTQALGSRGTRHCRPRAPRRRPPARRERGSRRAAPRRCRRSRGTCATRGSPGSATTTATATTMTSATAARTGDVRVQQGRGHDVGGREIVAEPREERQAALVREQPLHVLGLHRHVVLEHARQQQLQLAGAHGVDLGRVPEQALTLAGDGDAASKQLRRRRQQSCRVLSCLVLSASSSARRPAAAATTIAPPP